uniref:Uncharacterized protein n=1 Tax=Rhizophora mucronata TaxID=61149 RepID=A0A2P2PCW0_RHIMU
MVVRHLMLQPSGYQLRFIALHC